MLSDWYVVVSGEAAERALLIDLCGSSPDHSLDEEQPGEWRLRSSTLAAVDDHETAWSTAGELLVRLSDAAAAAAGTRLRLTTGTLGRTHADGTSDVFVHPEPARVTVRAFPPTVSVDGIAPEPLGAKLSRLQMADDHVRLALHFLNADESWFNLWKAFEAIREGKGLAVAGARSPEIDRFRRTANTYAAVGDEARHALLGVPAAPNPMTLLDADEFVRGLLSRWVASLP